MSVDLVVFDPAVAPRDGNAFRDWYHRLSETDFPEEGELERLSPQLRRWYDAMTEQFPDFIRTDTDDPLGIDYHLMPGAIHWGMPRGHSDREAGERIGFAKAKELQLGIYDMMSDDGRLGRHIVFPDAPLPDLPKPPSFFSKLFGKAKD
ncbi:hypothetical protein CD351_11850 [Erythrobacter sp. KY5]|uniref:hypothetical protein n=1 Tax=Erythrobacter sp. KY5 TaxID=2011159 RepID=UPI000DBF36F6|nr:hypothetical protein [Erythrobacter sp. KY5]AWW75121.1 hypothetical protein CD351_11850 [Erythrobacter sp. KY5]